MVRDVFSLPGFTDALAGKLLISIVAGWTRQQLETALYGSETAVENAQTRAWVLRAMPNVAALVKESVTGIEVSEPSPPAHCLEVASSMFSKIGTVVHLPPHLLDAATAVCGSTPAFFAIICEALIDGAVAMEMPRLQAHGMIYQATKGTAAILQGGEHPAVLKEKCTSPGGCTVGAIMGLEQAGVRGIVARALRESTTIAGLLGQHIAKVNATEQVKRIQ